MTEKMDYDRLLAILQENKDKNFIQRILSPGQYPSIQNKDGTTSTHRMSWAEVGKGKDRKYVVYPTIFYENKQLVPLDGDAAIERAMNTGEYVGFDKAEDADFFSKNYKKWWDGAGYRTSTMD